MMKNHMKPTQNPFKACGRGLPLALWTAKKEEKAEQLAKSVAKAKPTGPTWVKPRCLVDVYK
jgi:hypothetical protein